MIFFFFSEGGHGRAAGARRKVVDQAARANRSRATLPVAGRPRCGSTGRRRALRVSPERGHRRAGDPRRADRVRYAGTLDPGRRRGDRRGPRHVASGTVDEWAGLADPMASRAPPSPLGRRAGRVRHRRKIELARPRAADVGRRPRVSGSTTPTTPTRGGRSPSSPPPACAGAAGGTAATSASAPCRRRRRDPDRASGSASAGAPGVSTSTRPPRRRRPGHPAARRDEAVEPAPHGRARPVRDGAVPRHHLSTLNGEAWSRVAACSATSGELVASAVVTLVDDPTNPDAYTATDVDGEGLATRRNVLIDGGVLQQLRAHQLLGPPRRHRVDRQRRPRRLRRAAGRRLRRAAAAAGNRFQAEIIAGVDDGLLVQSVPVCTRLNPSAATSPRRLGHLIVNGALGAPSASSPSRRRCSACCSTSPKWVPTRLAADARRRVSLVIHDVILWGACAPCRPFFFCSG